MQVAGARWVEQNSPRDVALVLFAVLLLLRPCQQVAIDNECLEQPGAHLGIEPEYAHDQVVPIAAALDDVGERLALGGEHAIGNQLVDEVHDLVDVFLRVAVEIIDELVERCTLRGLCKRHGSILSHVLCVRYYPFVELRKDKDSLMCLFNEAI